MALRHSYRDPATGRFAPAPPPPPARPLPPRWADGTFIGRDKERVLIVRESEFTGKSVGIGATYATAQDAALAIKSIEDDEFLARAYSRVAVKLTPNGWLTIIHYNYPAYGEISP